MMQAVETVHLSKRYGRTWSLDDCTLQVPQGRIVGLVGPNGAGKTTLLQLIMGLLKPSSGSLRVFGYDPGNDGKHLLSKVGFVAQDHPLYKSFTVRDMLKMGQQLNVHWDQNLAMERLAQLGIPLQQPTGKLSGGQQAQVALVLALAKKPELLILDEPVASLDPLARREFQQALVDAVAQDTMTVIISSHIVTDLERFCDYLVLLASSHIQLTGEVEDLLNTHKLLVGPRERADSVAKAHSILTTRATERQCTLLVHMHGPIIDPAWEIRDVSLEDIILAYMDRSRVSVPSQQDKVKLEVLS
jgi:ABC-2 type transport system ATP-binding protein